MKIGKRLVAAAGIAVMAGCAGAGGGIVKGSGPLSFQPRDFPGKGQCRLWDASKPREAQSAPDSCDEVMKQLTPQAWMLRKAGTESVIVYIYSAGKVVETHEYDAHTADYRGKR